MNWCPTTHILKYMILKLNTILTPKIIAAVLQKYRLTTNKEKIYMQATLNDDL